MGCATEMVVAGSELEARDFLDLRERRNEGFECSVSGMGAEEDRR